MFKTKNVVKNEKKNLLENQLKHRGLHNEVREV